MDYPKKITINPMFDIQCSVSQSSDGGLVSWSLTVPIDKSLLLAGRSLIESIPECLPDINSTTIQNYIGTAEP